MLENLPDLSDREWELMNVCWKKKQLTVQDVIERSPEEEKKHYQTVKAQLDVLLNKGYLIREKFGPLWLYSPKHSQEEVVFKEFIRFNESLVGNYFIPFCINYMKSRKFSPEEILKLKEYVNSISENK